MAWGKFFGKQTDESESTGAAESFLAAAPIGFFALDAAGADPAAQVAAEMSQRAQASAGEVPRVGRNDPCPCGSGKKYKVCHGKLV
jgi:preprotein translocase subunit SecA